MKNPTHLFAAMLVALAASSIPAGAQASNSVSTHAPDYGTRETLISIDVPPKAGAPFSATVVTEWTRLLEDGTQITVRNHRLIARDGNGRVFQERRSLTPTGDKDVTQLTQLEYVDPNRKEFYACNPAVHLCFLSAYNGAVTIPEELAASATLPNGSVTREDLGRKTIENLEALGSRQVTTINPGGNNPYKVPEPTIKEFWFSPQLDINIVTQRFEPRGGAENFRVENINLSEPDPKLFDLPSGYKVAETYQR
jgi:hypothetical protein